MKVLWRSDLEQGKHQPLEIVAVETKTGSRISAALVVLATDHLGVEWARVDQAADDNSGLLEVIEAQMAAIDELSADKHFEGTPDEKLAGLQAWADQFPDMIADLCVALGFAAHPIGPTGIPELDKIVSLAR